MSIDIKLKQWATERQAQYIDAVNKYGSINAGAKALGIHRTTLSKALDGLKSRAATMGYSPEHGWDTPVPDGYHMKGVSTYDSAKHQWTKVEINRQSQREVIAEAAQGFADELPKWVHNSIPGDRLSDVIPWIQIGDAHIGMLAHASETGENFDIKIATTELRNAIAILLADIPNCERIVINDLGDFTHYFSFEGISKSGNTWDFDTRFPKMVRAASSTFKAIVEMALTKAKLVDVIINPGNHSRENDVWMGEFIKAVFGDTGRVNVLNNDNFFIGYRMGNTLCMTSHSDLCKPQHLANVMTTDFRKDYGETEFHYIDIGHWHTNFVLKEHPDIVIESFNHLAHTDKWAYNLGYRSRRAITVVFRSTKYGEIFRRHLSIKEIRDRMDQSKVYTPPERQIHDIGSKT